MAWEIGRTGTSDYDVFVDEVVSLLGRAQAEDGYLNTWVQGGASDQKLSAMRWSHELYCLGHLIQAAIAFARTTGRHELLEIASGMWTWSNAS
ncbi:glycoside hydrolase family 127 protein [Arthrobacter alpinus]|nr:glycoside hydrolase family 127 protein [Arthrobacter alpinus]